MATMEVNGVRLHVTDSGGDGPPVVFSHSYLLSSEHFQPQIEALRPHYRCIAFDHRAHGQSQVTRSGYAMENIYADAVGLLEALRCTPCHFVGLSTGGFVGMRLAIRRPELLRSLVLMDTSADAESPRFAARYRAMGHLVRLLGWRPLVPLVMRSMFGPEFLRDPGRRDERRRWRQQLRRNPRRAMARFGDGIFSRRSVREQLGQVALPTLVLVGAQDRATPPFRARRIAEAIAGAQLQQIPGAGHLCTVERPEAVNRVLRAFLDAQPR